MSLLNIGSRSLAAAQGVLGTISHNIANANTEGYSRQEAVLATAGGLYTGAGFFGRGVDLSTVRRQYDQFLTAAVQDAAAVHGADSARAQGLQALDSLFGDSPLGIGAALDHLFSAAGDLANRPSDMAVRQVFIGRATQLAQRLTAVGGEVEGMMRQADAQLAQGARDVNSQLDVLRRLNTRIAEGTASGQMPNDLLDQRDSAVQKLQGLLALKSVPLADGSVNLYTTAGAPLLVGSQMARLEALPSPADRSQLGLRLQVGAATQWLQASELAGGSLAGALRLRDEDLATVQQRIGAIAHQLAQAFNAQQATGIDANGQPGAALFRLPPAAAVAHGDNQGAGSVGAAVADAAALRPSDYEVHWDGSNYTVTRLSDQSVTSGPLPATIDGLSFTASGTPMAGDRWRIQRMGPFATGLAVEPLRPQQIATGLPATVEAGANNQGVTRIAGVEQVSAPALPDGTVQITFGAGGSYSAQRSDGTALGSGTLGADGRVPAAGDYNGWVLRLDGAPAAGDSYTLRRVTNPAGDNRNALALQSLADQGLLDGQTLNASYAGLLGEVGARVQAAGDAAAVSARLQSETVGRQQAVSGVNLDEEAANLLRYQQAYQACARIVQTSQSLFDALLSATGR